MRVKVGISVLSACESNGHTVAEERAREQAEEAARMDVQVKVEDDEPDQASMGENRVLEFDDTSEFVQAIQYNPVVKEESRVATLPPATADSKNFTPARTRTDSPMETDEVVHELEAGEVTVKEEEDDDDDEAMLNAIEAAINTAEAEMVNKEAGAEPEVSTIVWCFL